MAPKNDKNKSSSAAPAANSDIIGDSEIGSSENLAKTIQRLQELQKETLDQTATLSAIVTQNKQATETNAETIKKVEGWRETTTQILPVPMLGLTPLRLKSRRWTRGWRLLKNFST